MKLGILGGGQLGRMLALAAAPLDVRCRVYEPEEAPPAAGLAEHVRGSYDDDAALIAFARGLDAVTCEFENVPARCLATLEAAGAKIFPPARAFAVAQDRLDEKQFFRGLGIATAPFAAVDSASELEAAIAQVGYPAVLKTRRLGYDGKGQRILRAPQDLAPALVALGGRGLILEGWVSFTRELSVLAVRSGSGEVRWWTLPANRHDDGILRESRVPAPGLSARTARAAEEIAQKTLVALSYVGVLAVELFETEAGLVVNEMAPRVHNTGHWTIEGARTSQFENHVRAGLGLPLGDCSARGHAVMLNLIGNVPATARVLAVPGAHLHLYGKAPRPGRKLGHITVVEREAAALDNTLAALRETMADVMPGHTL